MHTDMRETFRFIKFIMFSPAAVNTKFLDDCGAYHNIFLNFPLDNLFLILCQIEHI